MAVDDFSKRAQVVQALPADALSKALEAQGLKINGGKDSANMVDVEQLAQESTYKIIALSRSAEASWLNRQGGEELLRRPSGWNGYEDRWCLRCNGVAHIECTNRACKQGVVIVRRTEIIEIPNAPARSKLVKDTETCGVCGGKGRLSCPDCSNGFDSSL
jgi:hypothetical protein